MNEAMANIKNILWPPVDTEEEAKKASRTAAGFCFFIAVVTGGLAFLQSNKMIEELIPGLDASAYVDAGLFALIGILLLRYSRIAALAGLLLYTGEQIYIMKTMGFRLNIMMVFIFCSLIAAVRGTFAYHSLKGGGQKSNLPSEASVRRMEAMTKLFFQLLIVAGLCAAAYFTYAHFTKQSNTRMFQRSSGPSFSLPKINLPQVKLPSMGAGAEKTEGQSTAAPQETAPGPKVTLKLKNGKTVSGKVTYEDETYYTIETAMGDEVVIKDDIAS